MTLAPDHLAELLAELCVDVETVHVETTEVPVHGYGGVPRPTGRVLLSGGGHTGEGEFIGWTADEQRCFAERAERLVSPGPHRVGDAIAVDARPYERAAVEGALIDLAMRQRGLTLARLAGGPGVRPLRWVVSFDQTPDPARRVRTILRRNPGVAFKIDVDPKWTAHTMNALRELPIAVLDFKNRGTAELVEHLFAIRPDPIYEDPPAPPPDGAAVALDRSVLHASDVDRRPATHVNLKAPRMGGFIEALRGIARAREAGRRVYFGGMFEVGAGRRQARQLAALYCPDAPNDLAPQVEQEGASRGPRPTAIRLDLPGFGVA